MLYLKSAKNSIILCHSPPKILKTNYKIIVLHGDVSHDTTKNEPAFSVIYLVEYLVMLNQCLEIKARFAKVCSCSCSCQFL